MRKLFVIIMAVFLVPVFLASCAESEEEYDYQYDGDIFFAFRYDSLLYEDDYIGFRLYLSTKEIFGCVNYSIVTEEEYRSNRIDVHSV